MDKLKVLFNTSRPVSWVNTAYPFGLCYIVSGAPLNLRFFLIVLFFLIPYNLLMYGVNDVFDYESDIKNPRKGGIEGAITPKKYHKMILTSSVASCSPFLALMIFTGSLVSNIVLVVLVFFVAAYSAKGLRFKEVPFLDSVTSSIHFVGPAIYALALVGNVEFNGWLLVLAFFLWGMASHAFGAVQDIKPDREAGISSIATVLGAKLTVRFSALLYLTSAIIVIAQGGYLIVLGVFTSSYLFNIINLWNINDQRSGKSNIAWKRFMKLNYIVGAAVTVTAILASF